MMAIILIEEVLMGLDVVKTSLDHAVMVLEELVEDLAPHLQAPLKEVLETTLLSPLQSRAAALKTLLDELAATV
jgi:hypothetical protein